MSRIITFECAFHKKKHFVHRIEEVAGLIHVETLSLGQIGIIILRNLSHITRDHHEV